MFGLDNMVDILEEMYEESCLELGTSPQPQPEIHDSSGTEDVT